MQMKRLTSLSLVILTICAVFTINILNVYADNTIVAPARAMVVLEGNTNEILYEFKKDLRLPMASVTKIATAILAIESSDLNEVIKVDDSSVGLEGTSIYLNYDEEISMENLLYGLMLASGNDCAMAIACHVGGDGGSEKFVQMMNELAQKLNLENTHFDNPHGLDSETHYTSAYDLAVLTSYALKNETFKEIVSTKYKTIDGNDITGDRYLKNKNKLLFSRDDCIGVKTGFTDNAGRCLVNACEKDGMQVISVVLNCGPMFEECERLTNLAYENYKLKTFVEPYSYVSNIKVENGDKEEVGVATINGFKKVIKKEDEDKYRVEYNLPNSVVAPVEYDTIIGNVKVYFEENEIFNEDLYAIDSSRNIDIKYLIENIIGNW